MDIALKAMLTDHFLSKENFHCLSQAGAHLGTKHEFVTYLIVELLDSHTAGHLILHKAATCFEQFGLRQVGLIQLLHLSQARVE